MERRPGAVESLVIDPAFWRGRRVFVTGHTGFMGGWLTLTLHRLGAEVHGYALDPPTTPSLFDLAAVRAVLAADVRADIGDSARLTAAVRAARPDVVFHLAAQPLVLESYAHPVATYATNVLGTVHVLEALREGSGVRAAVIVTSDKCYSNDGTGRAFAEGDPLGGDDPYSSSKACAELVTAAYRASFFAASDVCRIASVRAGNVIGGGDWGANRLVPDCVRAARANQPVPLRHPGAIRPWQHVLDAVRGYLLLVQKMCGAGGACYAAAWNFGPPAADAISVETVAAEIMAGLGGRVIADERPDSLHEASVLHLDATRAAAQLGWRQALPVRAALAETVAWYAAWAAGQDMAAITRGQIERHLPA